MGDCPPLEELLFRFCLSQYPALLQEEEVFDQLLRFVHGLLRRAKHSERERLLVSVRRASAN